MAPNRKPQTREKILRFIKRFHQKHGYPPTVREIGTALKLSSPATIHRHLGILEEEGKLKRSPNRQRAIVLLDESGKPVVSKPSASPVAVAAVPQTDGDAGDVSDSSARPPNQVSPENAVAPDNTASVINLDSYRGPVPRPATQDVPLFGQIAAGAGTLAEQSVEDVMTLPTELCGHGNLFMLQVRGDSMEGAAILDGDYVVARSQPTADDGDIVVAGIHEDEATVKIFHRSGHPLGTNITLTPANPHHTPREFPATEISIHGKVVSILRRL